MGAVKDSGIPRDEVFLMSMLPQWHLGYNETMASFSDSLAQLGTTYVDLYMFHWPGLFVSDLPMLPSHHPETCGIPVTSVPECKKGQASWRQCRLESWRAMRDLQAAGKIKAIGTSNFEIAQLQELIDAGQAPAVNQIEYHIGYHDDFLNKWSRDRGILLQAYSPLSGGKLAQPTDPTIIATAAAHNVSGAQVALRFAIQNNVSIIPKAGETAYQLENMRLFDWSLSEEEIAKLGALANPYRRGVSDGMSQMCIDEQKGSMARCIYLDQYGDRPPPPK